MGACLVPGEGDGTEKPEGKRLSQGKVCECCFGKIVVSQMM